MKVDGACHCGAITVAAEVDPQDTTICHCTDCQSGTGAAFRVTVAAAGDSFKMTGQPTAYLKTTAASGRPRIQTFCPTCGSPIFSTSPGEHPRPSYNLRVGILRQRDRLLPKRQIWVRSALPWLAELDAIAHSDLATVPASQKIR